jgi:4-amino-4-deoxy-L-arabinose transferase-like glycosyltransferase
MLGRHAGSHARDDPLTRTRWLWLCLAVATLLRLLALWQFAEVDRFHGDEGYFQRAATGILAGQGHPGSLRPPLFPFFVAAVYSVFGKSLLALRLVQIVLSLVAVLAVFRITAARFGVRAAAYAGLLCAVAPSLVHYTHFLWSECFAATLLILFFWALDAHERSGRLVPLAGAGLLLGLNALTRETWAFFGVIVAGWIVWSHRAAWRRSLVPVATFVGAMVLVVLPWTLRNYVVHHAFVLVSTGRWYPMVQGNSLNEHDWVRGVVPMRALREAAKPLSEVEQDAYWKPIALEAIRAEQPWWIFKKMVRNTSLMLQVRSQSVRYVEKGWFSPPRWSAWTLVATSVGGHILITALGLTGLWLVPGERLNKLLVSAVIYTFAVHVLAVAHSRYLVPLVPLLAIHAGALLARRGLDPSRLRLTGAALTLATFAIALVLRWNHDLSGALVAIAGLGG